MSAARMFCFGVFLFRVSSSIVDDNNLDIFQSSSVPDLADPALLSVVDWNGDKNPDIFNDINSSDLFAGSIPLDDSTLLADCGSTGNDLYHMKKKARIRRRGDTLICPGSTTPLPALSLPTLDQAFPADTDEGYTTPNQPKKKGLRVPQDWLLYGRLGLSYIDYYLKCPLNGWKLCSSDDLADIKPDGSGRTFTLEHAQSVNEVTCLYPKVHFCCLDFYDTGRATQCRPLDDNTGLTP